MRKKLISTTYLKDVDRYNLNIFFNQSDYYVCVKKIIDIKTPFVSPIGTYLINNGYYIIEVIPKKENYAMRVFFNEKKERLLYYFDITRSNGVDEKTKIPYYDDLYLDVTFANGEIRVLDEDELQEALDRNLISKDDFVLANKTKDLLVESINKKENKYINLDLESYLD